MGYISIAFNIFTIILVGLVFYITNLSRQAVPSESFLETFKRVWSSETQVNKAISSVPVGNIGTFEGYEWPNEKTWVYIKNLDMDNWSSFIEEGSPNRIGITPT